MSRVGRDALDQVLCQMTSPLPELPLARCTALNLLLYRLCAQPVERVPDIDAGRKALLSHVLDYLLRFRRFLETQDLVKAFPACHRRFDPRTHLVEGLSPDDEYWPRCQVSLVA